MFFRGCSQISPSTPLGHFTCEFPREFTCFVTHPGSSRMRSHKQITDFAGDHKKIGLVPRGITQEFVSFPVRTRNCRVRSHVLANSRVINTRDFREKHEISRSTSAMCRKSVRFLAYPVRPKKCVISHTRSRVISRRFLTAIF